MQKAAASSVRAVPPGKNRKKAKGQGSKNNKNTGSQKEPPQSRADAEMLILRRILWVLGVAVPLILVLMGITATYYVNNHLLHQRIHTWRPVSPSSINEWPSSSPGSQIYQQQQTKDPTAPMPPQPKHLHSDSVPTLDKSPSPMEQDYSWGHDDARLQDGASKSFFLEDEVEVECDSLCVPMVEAIERGSFSHARYLALQVQNSHPECESTLAEQYTQHADLFLSERPAGVPLSRVALSQENPRNRPVPEEPNCWNPGEADGWDLEEASQVVLDRWDSCCSRLTPKTDLSQPGFYHNKGKKDEEQCYQDASLSEDSKRRRLCCGLYPGTLTHLRLPALQETTITLRLMESPTIAYQFALEQDGFLRKYDASGVLWPTGYMLAACIADPEQCGMPEILQAARSHHDTVVSVELGAGVGAPSIAMSRLLKVNQVEAAPNAPPRVLATDRAMHALALIATNGMQTGVPVLVTHTQDHTNTKELEEMMERTLETIGGGYGIVLGSSLQSLFDWKTRDPQHTLWKVLNTLVCRINPDAIAVLAHVSGAVVPPSEGGIFELVRTVSGNQLGMMTRSGDDSDFEISVYRRKRYKTLPGNGFLKEF